MREAGGEGDILERVSGGRAGEREFEDAPLLDALGPDVAGLLGAAAESSAGCRLAATAAAPNRIKISTMHGTLSEMAIREYNRTSRSGPSRSRASVLPNRSSSVNFIMEVNDKKLKQRHLPPVIFIAKRARGEHDERDSEGASGGREEGGEAAHSKMGAAIRRCFLDRSAVLPAHHRARAGSSGLLRRPDPPLPERDQRTGQPARNYACSACC